MKKNDFFIGWSDQVPKANAKAIRLLLIPLFMLIPLLVFVLIYYEKPFTDHQFELGQVQEFSGVYLDKPKPMLVLDDGFYPDNYNPNALLVGYGKFGAESTISRAEQIWGDLSNNKVKLRGTLLYGDGRVIIELTEGANSVIDVSKPTQGMFENPFVGEHKSEYEGEIIDPKCWFGAMKPGEGKVHKSCAIRCISGGIPPVLRIKQNEKYVYFILESVGDENINVSVLEFVGELVTVQGLTYIQNGWNVLKTSATQINYKN